MFGENAMDRSAADHARRAIALPFAGKAPFGRKLVRDRFHLADEHAVAVPADFERIYLVRR